MKELKFFLISVFILLLAACTNLPASTPGSPAGGADPLPAEPSVPAPTPTSGVPVLDGPISGVPGQAQPTTPATATDEQFVQKMVNAIQSRDFPSLRGMMSPRFSFATWNTGLIEMTSEEAIARLEGGEMAQGSAPVMRFEVDVPSLLGGADPLAQWGPVAQPIRAVYINGLGGDQSREAIVVFARDSASGTLYFHGLMVPETGQFSTSGQPLDAMQALSEHLALAIEQRDVATLRVLMRDRFAIATWNSSLEVIDSDDAMERLQGAQLAPGAQPAVIWGTDIPAMLLGTDPLSLWGPVDQTVRAMHVMGLGSDTSQEAVLVIGREPGSGDFYWHGILIPPDGYFHTADPNAQPTDIRFVRAKEDVNLRTGPGKEYAVEGKVFAGMTLQVAGKSADSAWWHIRCEQDSSGYCWVSADPTLTEPVPAP